MSIDFDPTTSSKQFLDSEYNVRDGIPDHEEVFERWLRSTEAFRANPKVRVDLDINYGEHPSQSIDLYSPVGTPGKPRPVLVFIHGGYWQSLDKAHFGFIAEPYVDNGVAVAVVNYRLAPEVTMDEIVDDVRASILKIHTFAPEYGLAPDAIYVSGHSAGGHLTAMMMATDWGAFGAPGGLVKGGCAISGLYDLEPIRHCYLNDVLQLDEQSSLRNSPSRLDAVPAAPLVLTVGGDESSEFHRQQEVLERKLVALKVPCETIPMKDGHHFHAVERLGQKGALSERLLEIIAAG